MRRPLRRHNLPMLVSCQVGKGPRQAGTHAIREQGEAQVALTYSIVLAVLAHQHDIFLKVHGSQQVVQAVLNLHPDFVRRNLVQLFP